MEKEAKKKPKNLYSHNWGVWFQDSMDSSVRPCLNKVHV